MPKRLLAGLLFFAGGCSHWHVPHPSMPSMPSMSMPRFSRGTGNGIPNDANVLAMMLAANNSNVSYARLVPYHTQTPAVRDYAARMLREHEEVVRVMTETMNRIDLPPEDNPTSFAARDLSAEERDRLRETTGSMFDSLYMANEIRFHEDLLHSLDKVMIPATHNPTLKQTLVAIRPAVASHLEHAQTVAAGLKRP